MGQRSGGKLGDTSWRVVDEGSWSLVGVTRRMFLAEEAFGEARPNFSVASRSAKTEHPDTETASLCWPIETSTHPVSAHDITPLHCTAMASLKSALRLAPRAQFVRPSPTTRITPLAQRCYAAAASRPATDAKPASAAEQGSEDLHFQTGEDPNMVSHMQCRRWSWEEHGLGRERSRGWT